MRRGEKGRKEVRISLFEGDRFDILMSYISYISDENLKF